MVIISRRGSNDSGGVTSGTSSFRVSLSHMARMQGDVQMNGDSSCERSVPVDEMWTRAFKTHTELDGCFPTTVVPFAMLIGVVWCCLMNWIKRMSSASVNAQVNPPPEPKDLLSWLINFIFWLAASVVKKHVLYQIKFNENTIISRHCV